MVVNSGVCREGLIDVVSDDHISGLYNIHIQPL